VSTTAKSLRRNIADLRPGELVDYQVFRVVSKELRTASNGALYLHAVLADATGQLVARMWNTSAELYETIPEGGFLICRGRTERYSGKLQFIIDALRPAEPGSFDPAELLPSTTGDVEAMWNEVKSILRRIRNPSLLALLGRFINDESFVSGFKRAPAAVVFHHAWLGGLLEHTLNTLRLARVVCPLYPEVDQDLVLAGLFLHDAGKIRELAYDTGISYTSEGQLIGHITEAALWIRQKCAEIEAQTGQPFPRELETALQHIVVSHHGKHEFGSPRLPATPEAMMVHCLDNLDAKLSMMFEAIHNDPDATSDWTAYVKALETRVFKARLRSPAGAEPGADPSRAR
jgi:3'-5' exoribonuclease